MEDIMSNQGKFGMLEYAMVHCDVPHLSVIGEGVGTGAVNAKIWPNLWFLPHGATFVNYQP